MMMVMANVLFSCRSDRTMGLELARRRGDDYHRMVRAFCG